MYSRRPSIQNALRFTLQRLLVWSLAIGAALVPLLYEQYLEGNGKQAGDAALQNRAAIAFCGYLSAGRLVIAGPDGHRKLDLKMPLADWENFKPAERGALARRAGSARWLGALARRVAGIVLRGIPIESYVIRDDAGNLLAGGAGDGWHG